MVLGSTTTTAEHSGGPPGVHTYTPWTASVYEWTDNCPSPDSYSWQREGGTASHQKAKGGIKKNKAVRPGGGKEAQQSCSGKYVLWFVFSLSSARWYWRKKNTGNQSKFNPRPNHSFKQLTINVYWLLKAECYEFIENKVSSKSLHLRDKCFQIKSMSSAIIWLLWQLGITFLAIDKSNYKFIHQVANLVDTV